MGRKRTRFFENITYDRIGEPVNMDKCPECAEHPDCFACINGKCTALSENGGQGCVFYKPEQQALQEVQRAYSDDYRMYSNIDPDKLIKNCHTTAIEDEKKAIYRRNKRKIKELLKENKEEKAHETGKSIV